MPRGYRYLVNNMLLLTAGNLGSKILTFLLVPLYTSVLTTEEYGTYDLLNNAIGLLVPVLTVDIAQSVMRLSLDKGSDKSGLLCHSLGVFFLGLIPLCLFTVLNYHFAWITVLRDYAVLFIVLYAVSFLAPLSVSFAKGLDCVASVALSGIVSTLVLVVANIVFLLVFRWGLRGYFIATISGMAAQCIYLAIATKMWRYLSPKNLLGKKRLLSQMVGYSRPLIANDVAWWINNLSDRYIVTWFCGTAANGVYSVGFKIPSILNAFQGVFAGAWGLSAIQDFDPKDSNGFFRETYALYNFFTVALCSLLIVLDKPIASLLFANDFYEAWVYVPFLLIAMVFGGMSGYLGGLFNAAKDSKGIGRSTVVGAFANIVLNLVTVPFMGAMGAALSTAVAYALVWALRLHGVRKHIELEIKLARDWVTYAVLIAQALLMLFLPSSLFLYFVQFVLFAVVVVANRRELLMTFDKAKNLIDTRRKTAD